MDIPRPRSSGRGRSSSRGRGTFRGGNARPQSRKRSENTPIPLEKQPQKKESLESIEQYEKKKREDPEHKDISISQFFTEWIDLKRTNITGELNDFETDIIKKYTDFLKNTLDLRKVPKDERTEITDSMKSGMILALSIRLLRTASNSQSQLDNEYHRLITEIEKFEIPSFYNTTLSNVGKFTDPTFGNFRLEYPLTKSKQKVVEAMILKTKELQDQYSFKPGKSRQDFNKWWESIIKGNPNLYIFDERDTVEYLKYQGERHFELFRSENFKITCKNKQINFSFPFFEFSLLTKETVGEYIKLITDMDSTFSEDIKNQRDKLIACLLFQLANSDFVENPDLTISDWMPYFDGNFPVLADVKIRDLYNFMGLTFLGDFLDDRSLKHNAKIIYNDYMETAYPMMKKNFNMSELTNDAFGNTAQLIEVPYIDKNHYASERRDFKAITKLKDANLNVFGALFNYTKNLNFKRKIISTLSTTSDNILTTFTQKDLRYKINK